MRIAITARGPSPRADVDRCFGRAYWFLIYDLDSKEWTAVDNYEIRSILQNAGELACQLLKEHQVDELITGETGPTAFRRLTEENIRVYHNAIGCPEDMLLAWSLQKLTPAKAPKATGNPECLNKEGKQQIDQPAGAPKLELSCTRYYEKS